MIDVYLATPYSDPSAEVRRLRYEQVTALTGELSALGLAVYSPITHSVPLVPAMEKVTGNPDAWEAWAEIGRKFVAASRELWVFELPGWEKSVGVTAEIALAHELRRPVRFVPNGAPVRGRVLEVLIADWRAREGAEVPALNGGAH